jgi:hypothetical protein
MLPMCGRSCRERAVEAIFAKLAVNNRVAAVAVGRTAGLLD